MKSWGPSSCSDVVSSGVGMLTKPMTTKERFYSYAALPNKRGCMLWLGGRTNDGYGQFHVRVGTGKYRNVRAARFSYELHNGPIPDGLNVLHRCDNPPCVAPEHLFVGTTRDNALDMMAKDRGAGYFLSGEEHPRLGAKLTEDDVRAIRAACKDGNLRQWEIAEQYGISRQQVSEIHRRTKWRHVV